jgi:pantoate--beta-alanine ligase
VAYFGDKDAQQLAIVRRLVADFSVPVSIVGVPTVREPDGLALSSRNQRLDAAERQLAPALYRALRHVAEMADGGVTDVARLVRGGSEQIPSDARVKLEYLEIVDPNDFQPVQRVTGPAIAAGAIWVGTTRLIDNLRLEPGQRD